jgi:hypothetical protein
VAVLLVPGPTGARRALAGLAAGVVVAGLTGCSLADLGDRDGAMTKIGDRDPDEITEADFAAVQEVLDRRGRALRDGDRRAFLRTLDPGNRRLRQSQLVLFDNVQRLPVGRYFYGTTGYAFGPAKVRGGDPVLRPEAYEHVQLDGVFQRPVTNEVAITFVRRDGRWLVGDERRGPADSRPWFGTAIELARDDEVLVVTDRGSEVSAAELLSSTRAALVEVADVLDQDDQRPLLVDATSNGRPERLTATSKEEAAAVSFDALSRTRDGEEVRGVAGAVVKANPDAVDQLVESPRTLRHELVHYLLDGYGGTLPIWVSEGIAEYVAYYPGLLSRSTATTDRLRADIAARPVELTPTHAWGGDPDLDYLLAEASVEHLVQTYGLDRFFDFMAAFEEVGKRYGEGHVDRLLQKLYGVGADEVARGVVRPARGVVRVGPSGSSVGAQERRRLLHERLGGGVDVVVAPEAVRLPEPAGRDDGHAGRGDLRREQLSLVAARVVLGGGDEERRQGAEPVGGQRRARSGSDRSGRSPAYCRQYQATSSWSKPEASVRCDPVEADGSRNG